MYRALIALWLGIANVGLCLAATPVDGRDVGLHLGAACEKRGSDAVAYLVTVTNASAAPAYFRLGLVLGSTPDYVPTGLAFRYRQAPERPVEEIRFLHRRYLALAGKFNYWEIALQPGGSYAFYLDPSDAAERDRIFRAVRDAGDRGEFGLSFIVTKNPQYQDARSDVLTRSAYVGLEACRWSLPPAWLK
jgi:hypothetical protein